jgi:transposase
LAEHQEAIEMRLFQRRFGQAPPQLFLYDVTSTYLEGVDNILAAFGYNRDGKKGKQQLVIGLLAASDGTPVAVRVFEGNTSDTATVASQVRILAEKFGVEEVVLVGDRGMIKKKQIKLLHDADFHYITALTKPQIKKFLAKGVFQLGLFDDQLCEVSHESIRYVLRRNPVCQQEIAQSRDDRIKSLYQKATRETNYLTEHPKAKVETALKKLTSQRERYGLADFVEILVTERTFSVVVDEEGKKTTSILDGCYVITTDLSGPAASAEVIHDRYKDLAKVERAFRTWKTGHLELRPVHVRTEESTRGHVFVVMLAYLIERELDALWRNFDMTVPEAIDQLGSLRGTIVKVNQITCQKVPQPAGDIKKLLDAADIHLPGVLPVRSVKVATRRKLTTRRKKSENQ